MNNIQTEQVELKTHIKKSKQNKIKKIVISLFLAVVFFMITTTYSQYQIYTIKKLETNNKVSSLDVSTNPNKIVEAVSRHIMLPDTTPQIATVEDAKKLSTSQAFFKDAANGDVVLVYKTTIILYRPSLDIIVAVGDISGVSK